MKTKLLIAAAVLAAPFAPAADGPLKEKGVALAAAHKDSVLFLSAVVEIEISAGEGQTRKEERKLEMLGTVIGTDGLIVAPLSTLDVAANIDGRTVNGPQGPIKLSAKGTTKEVKIIMPDGSEVPAKVSFKDPDLDLAFIRPEKSDGVKFTPVNTAENAPLELLDDAIVLGRLSKDLNREPVVFTTEIVSVIGKPRTFGKLGDQALGMPAFNKDGKFLGIGINRFSPKGETDQMTAAPNSVILPAVDLLESAAQAK